MSRRVSYEKVVDVDDDADEAGKVVAADEVTSSSNAADAITVKVKSSDEKTHDVKISESETVLGLKRVLEGITGLPPQRQRLICLGRLLSDEKTLKDSNVKDGNFVHLVPKPAAACEVDQGAGDSQHSRQHDGGLDEMHIPVHIQEMLVARGELPGARFEHQPNFTFEEEYELSIWKYRVRVMAMLMLFYYFMTFMAAISIWLHPDDADEYQEQQGEFRQVKSDLPLTLVDTLENVLGIIVSFVGIQAAVRDSPRISRKFARELATLAVVHFINLFMWIGALFRHEIIHVPAHHRYGSRASEEDDEETTRSIVGAMLIVHPMLWLAMLSIAFRYHKLLVQRAIILSPPEAQPIEPSDADASGSGNSNSNANRNNESAVEATEIPRAAQVV